MYYSLTFYVADGTTTDFDITFPYLSRAHIRVFQDGAELTYPDGWNFLSPTRIRLAVMPPNGAVVRVSRETSRGTRLVDYETPSSLNENDLDTDSLQAFYLAQEAFDATSATLAVSPDTGQWDAQNLLLKNVPDPVDPMDAVNKQYADTTISAAQASADAAAASEGNAATSEGNAAAHEAAALGYRDAAQAIVDAHDVTAYEIAVNNGFVGTEAEWLDSLVGRGVTMQGTVPTASDLSALEPSAVLSDAYMTLDTAEMFVFDGTTFVSGGSLRGPVGPEGPQGPTGPEGMSGAALFRGDNGETGDATNGLGDIFRVHSNTLSADVTIATGENALAAGPLTVAPGVTLTVSAGGSLVIA